MQMFLDFMELVSFWKCYDITHRKYKTTSNQFFKIVNINVKFTLEQDIKAQREGDRGIAVLFL